MFVSELFLAGDYRKLLLLSACFSLGLHFILRLSLCSTVGVTFPGSVITESPGSASRFRLPSVFNALQENGTQ